MARKVVTNKLLTRKGKRLEVEVPAVVKSGNVLELRGACQPTDGPAGRHTDQDQDQVDASACVRSYSVIMMQPLPVASSQ
jgi:hypothetical protein